jgi:formate hydrogenlyase subunit 6/NADH:ubiquinone oxidoreductase subunit I
MVVETEEGLVITRSFSLDSCTFCSNCSDFCPRKAIELTQDYHMVGNNPAEFTVLGTYTKKAPVRPAASAAPKPGTEKSIA